MDISIFTICQVRTNAYILLFDFCLHHSFLFVLSALPGTGVQECTLIKQHQLNSDCSSTTEPTAPSLPLVAGSVTAVTTPSAVAAAAVNQVAGTLDGVSLDDSPPPNMRMD